MVNYIETKLSAMTDAANNISKYTEDFKNEADQTWQAVQVLKDGWTGDASDEFARNMEQLHRWMNEMVTVLESYSALLHKARGEYEETDITAAKNFPT